MNEILTSEVVEVRDIAVACKSADVIILAAGFEERAWEFISKTAFEDDVHVVLIRYKNDIPGNRDVFKKFRHFLWNAIGRDRVHIVGISSRDTRQFETDFEYILNRLPRSAHRFGIDVSGMTSYLTCLVLNSVRMRHPFGNQQIFYTSAKIYQPSKKEYHELIQKQGGEEIDYIPKSMALEMSENLVIDTFSGYQNRDGKTCLCLFAGYEVHRSSGVLEDVNPSILLLLYGKPGTSNLEWRLELSRKLHRRFERSRGSATEIVSTLDPREGINVLEEYYNYLIDDYDFIIAPVCSKMNVISAYLFWERYGEVQLTFPLPIGYNPELSPVGVDKTYMLTLPPRQMLFKSV